jgi:hypothetical protein
MLDMCNEKKILLCVGLDTECDKNLKWGTRFPLQFRSVLEGIPKKLTPLFNQYGIKPTYFLSPEVLYDTPCVDLLSHLPNCELGAHMHAEFIGPDAEPDATRTRIVQAELTVEVERKKLQNLTSLFISHFGYAPKSFRAGRFGLSHNSLRILSDLGYLVDSSVTPFYSHEFSDRKKSQYWGAPVDPYFPARNDYRRKGSLRILEVPITVINPTLLRWPRFILRRMHNQSFIHKRLLPRLGLKVQKTSWLRPKYSSADEMIAISERLLSIPTRKKPHVLNMMYHTMEVIPGASPYAITDEDVDNIIKTQSTFFDHLFSSHDIECMGISQVRNYFT